jgi:hypothetical protein
MAEARPRLDEELAVDDLPFEVGRERLELRAQLLFRFWMRGSCNHTRKSTSTEVPELTP